MIIVIYFRYERLLKRAKTEDLSEISSLRCIYHTGRDRFGRPVIVFVGKNFSAATIDLEKVCSGFFYLEMLIR